MSEITLAAAIVALEDRVEKLEAFLKSHIEIDAKRTDVIKEFTSETREMVEKLQKPLDFSCVIRQLTHQM